jgi:FkbM family methyltransferase
MELHFNIESAFTRWVTQAALLHEPFVVIDVGVQAGEHPRWHLLGDYLVVHGLDPIEEVVEGLRRQNATNPSRHYHWLGAGNADEERSFYFNAAEPFSSSFFSIGKDRFGTQENRREQERKVPVRRLDTLLAEGVIPPPDFLKVDVEGFEKEVLLGARKLLVSVLGAESETSFGISSLVPKSHLGELMELLLVADLLVFDLNFNRVPRASFVEALTRHGRAQELSRLETGRPATFNVLFARDLIDELDHHEHYLQPFRPVSVDQMIKAMIIYELYGLNDIAVDTAVRFRDRLAERLDVEKAVSLLADPLCRVPGHQADPSAEEVISDLRAKLGEHPAALERIQASAEEVIADLRAQLGGLRAQLGGHAEALERIQASRSWRFTAPVRTVVRFLRGQ